MKTIIALITALALATPAQAGDELGAFIAGAIVGAIVGKNKSEHHHHHHHTYRQPSVTLEPYDRGWNPRVACYTRPEYTHYWVITRWYNCYDEVIRVEKHPR